MPLDKTAAVNTAIADAQNLPALVSNLQEVDPELAQRIVGGALIAAKTPIGTLGATAVAYLSAKYGFGWDANFCAEVAGVILLLAAYLFVWLQKHPVTGFFAPKPVTPAPAPVIPSPPTV